MAYFAHVDENINAYMQPAILTERGSLNQALWGQGYGATRNSVKCP